MIGVDISAEAVADARRNAAINRITKAEFRAGAVEDVLEDLVRSAQFHDILAVIGERFLLYICNLFPVPDVPFLMVACSAQFHDIFAVIGERFLIVVIYSRFLMCLFHGSL